MPESNEPTKSVSVEEKKKSEDIHRFEWMIRPCEVYQKEFIDCNSMKGRFHQYFIFGKTLDCAHWNSDYQDCCRWIKHDSEEAFENIIEHEKLRRLERLEGHYKNNVWQKRDKPPEDWNAPLPEWLQKKYKNSFLILINEKENSSTRTSCTIS